MKKVWINTFILISFKKVLPHLVCNVLMFEIDAKIVINF